MSDEAPKKSERVTVITKPARVLSDKTTAGTFYNLDFNHLFFE